jgi:Glycosyl hydrolases family 35/Beta-galactosidase, galactose-binding domain
MKYLIVLSLLFVAVSIQKDSEKELKPKFSHPQIIRYDHNTFYINGKETFIYSGSFHYFRCDPDEWTDILQKIKAAGFNTIETYIPWNFHEQKKGELDLSMLDKFLKDCEQMGLYVIARPGPYICAEWDAGGFPRWLAGKGIGFRTASPQDIYWSRYWFNEVLPLIKKHLITNGGSTILLQIENEYDFYGVSDSQKVIYLKSLYQDVIQNGIDIPIITCWTKQSRSNTDSVFSQIMDAVNGYPGWNLEADITRIKQLEEQEPDAPPIFTELQGGWFTAIGDATVRHPDKYSAEQINALTKYVIAQGIKGLNYYMLYGGTNFDYWAGKEKPTSYDYTAPISECGGLWEKYYATKLIGDFLKYSNPFLANSHEITDGAKSDNQELETILLSDGNTGFLYVRNKTGKLQNATVGVNMPDKSSTDITVSIDSLDAYFLPIELPLYNGIKLNYSNVQLCGVTEYKDKPLVIAYGDPGENAILKIDSKVFSQKITSQDKLYFWNDTYVLLTSKERAEHCVVFSKGKSQIVLLSDSYLAIPNIEGGNNINLQTKPGENRFSIIVNGAVNKILLDGKSINYTTTSNDNIINFSMDTPDYSAAVVKYGQVRFKEDDKAEKSSDYRLISNNNGVYESLDSLEDYENGYTIYKGKFEIDGEKLLKTSYYSNDWHSIYIDDKLVQDLTGNTFNDYSKLNLSNGAHDIKIIYENKGRPNFGFMEEKKGIKSLIALSPEQYKILKKWKSSVQLNEQPGLNAAEADTGYDDSKWETFETDNNSHETHNDKQVGSWYRKIIVLTSQEAENNPKIIFEGISSSAVIYANGKQVYKFNHHGCDGPFDASLKGVLKSGNNLIALYVENEKGRGGIIGPIEFEYGAQTLLKLSQFAFHASLNGKPSGWQKPGFNDSDWSVAQKSDYTSSNFEIKWFRTWFKVQQIKNWVAPLNIHIESTGSLQIWLNGKLLGLYFAEGPQNDFYIPEGWLREKNSLVFVMRPGNNENTVPELKSFSIGYYDKYVVQKHQLIIEQ